MKVMLILCLIALGVIGGMAYVQSGEPNFFWTETYFPSSSDIIRGY